MPDDARERFVTASQFRGAVGVYMERSAVEPVFITKHSRPARVLLSIEEYERLKRRDTRRALHAAELDDDHRRMIKEADYGPADPNLEKPMD